MNLSKIKAGIKKEKRLLILILLTIVVYIMFTFISSGFGSARTLANIIYANASLFICAIAMSFIVIARGFDLSIAAANAFTGVITARLMIAMGGEAPEGIAIGILGIVIAMAAASLLEVLNGGIAAVFKVNAFIVTLASQSLFRGMALGLSDSRSIPLKNSVFTWLGQGDILGTGIPVVLVPIILLFCIAEYLLARTTFGRKLFAVGGNKDAAIASGIKADRQMVLIYAVSGLFVGLASVVTVGRASAAHPNAALDAEMEIITAIVLSGANLAGGQGNMRNTFVSALLLAIINTGLQRLAVSPYMQYVIKGSLILAVIIFDQVGVLLAARAKKNLSKNEAQSNLDTVADRIRRGEQKSVSLKNISKSFPGVKALDDVSLTVKCGTVHAVLGENGAGKSTLMKVLSGVYKKDEGTICVDELPIEIKSPSLARDLGISVIYQELSLIPELSVMQNVFLGKEEGGSKLKTVLDKKSMNRKTREILKSFDLNIDVSGRTKDYTVGQRQAIEIAKALSTNSWVIVMDEPTSAISEADKDRLFKIIKQLKEQNVAIVYISHRLSEIFEIADEVTVLRDGKTVFNAGVEELDEQTLIRHMVGRELNNIFDREKSIGRATILEVRNLSRYPAFEPISFEVRAGEVLGFSGLMGAGRTEIMRCIYGLDKPDGGDILLNGKKVKITCPADAIELGIGLVSEDRRREGIVPLMGVGHNISLATLRNVHHFGIVDLKKEEKIITQYVEKMRVKTPSLAQYIVNLSGGNQQKCCLAKCLANDPQVIILDEPTRGIDVGAKAEIHKLIDGLVKEGKAVIIISSELPEIIGACDRIIVLHEGQKMAEFSANRGEEITQELLMQYAAGNEMAS